MESWFNMVQLLDVGIKINDLNMSNSFLGGLEHGLEHGFYDFPCIGLYWE